MHELAEGLWWWTAAHPDWTPEQGGPEGWQQDVSSYAFDCGDVFLLVDPQSPPSLVDRLAEGRRPVVALTCDWHRRSTDEVVSRLGATMESGGCADTAAVVGEECVLWIPRHRAVVFGDVVIGEPEGLRIPDAWLEEGETHAGRAAVLRPVLDLPVEHVLPTHGKPAGQAELKRALT